MGADQADQAAGLIQRQARGRRRRQQYAATLQRLSSITVDDRESQQQQQQHRVQQWTQVATAAVVPAHACTRPELRGVLNKFALCHRSKSGDQLYYRYPVGVAKLAEVVGHELHRCQHLRGIDGIIVPADDVVQLGDQIVVTVETNANDRPLLEHIANLQAGVYNEQYVRELIAALARIVAAMHEREQVCGHLLPTKLYHDGTRLKLMAFGLGKYMPIADQQVLVPDLDGFTGPEVMHDHGAYRPWSDCYAIGALLHLLLTGAYITGDDDLDAISDEARDLMGCLLDPRPFHRLRAGDILQHRWLAGRSDDDGLDDQSCWVEIQANIVQLVQQRALFDRVLRRFLSGDQRQAMSMRFCHLLDYASFPGFGQPLAETNNIAEALRQAIEKFSAIYLSKSDQERTELDPLGFIAVILKEIAAGHSQARCQARARPSRLSLAYARSADRCPAEPAVGPSPIDDRHQIAIANEGDIAMERKGPPPFSSEAAPVEGGGLQAAQPDS